MKHPRTARRGLSMVYAIVAMTALIGMASFAVDLGRAQVAKLELRRSADVAARAGAAGLAVSATQAHTDATAWARTNLVDARLLPAGAVDVQTGVWETATKSFRTTLATGERANAVRVRLRCSHDTGNPVPTMWARLLGRDGVSIGAEAIAMYVFDSDVNHRVDGVANPFLSGMPQGTAASLNNPHNSPDYAGDPLSADYAQRRQSPPPVALAITPGQALEFDNISGTVRHDPNLAFYQPDGNLGSVGRNTNGNEHGIADMNAPINALVGVFLSDAAPNATAAPTTNLDFSTAASREFTELRPQLKQIFFIGDGVTQSGTKQKFVAPPGATRLYLATWDFYEWNNNFGHRVVKVSRSGRVVMVK